MVLWFSVNAACLLCLVSLHGAADVSTLLSFSRVRTVYEVYDCRFSIIYT